MKQIEEEIFIKKIIKEFSESQFIQQFHKAVNSDYEHFVIALKNWVGDPKIEGFLKTALKDGSINEDGGKFKINNVDIQCSHLIPTQSEIDIKKSLSYPLTDVATAKSCLDGKSVVIGGGPILTFNNRYIIDGHHRWSQIYCVNPKATAKCLNFIKSGLKPEEMLKSIQVAIAATNGNVQTAIVQGNNLLLSDKNEIKQFVLQNVKPDILNLFRQAFNIKTDEELASQIWFHCSLMQTHNKPIENAPPRGFMPQTNSGNIKGIILSLTKGYENALAENTVGMIDKILLEASLLLREDKVVNFPNKKYGNFVVLAGSPGAGKSYIINNFLHLDNYKILSSDIWLELLAKKDKVDLKNPDNVSSLHVKIKPSFDKYRTNFIQKLVKDGHGHLPNIIIDITGSSVPAVTDCLKLIENSDYVTTFIFVKTSKEEALKRNKERGRTVPEDFLHSIYDNITATSKAIIPFFDHVWEVNNETEWNHFKGDVNYDDNGKLISRQGKYSRNSTRIIKIK